MNDEALARDVVSLVPVVGRACAVAGTTDVVDAIVIVTALLHHAAVVTMIRATSAGSDALNAQVRLHRV